MVRDKAKDIGRILIIEHLRGHVKEFRLQPKRSGEPPKNFKQMRG